MKIKKYFFPISMLLAIVFSTIVGLFASDNFIKSISPLGDIFINMMFTLVVPLVFFTITSSIANLSKKTKLTKILSKTILIFVITSAISAVVMMIPIFFINPAKGVSVEINGTEQEKLSLLTQFAKAITVSDFSELFSKSHMLALIVFSLLFGIALRYIDKENILGKGLEILSSTTLRIVKMVMYYAPIGVFAYFASLINSYGSEII